MEPPSGQDVIRPWSNPMYTTGHLKVLKGNLAPDGCIAKTSGIRRPSYEFKAPDVLATILKPHQEDGLRWLQKAWTVGRPGVLLADDMGLGKTIQGLAFLAWLREGMTTGAIPKLPILIVAPTGLLRNWLAEHDRHLRSPGLGICVEAFGRGLSRLRQEDKDGRPGLDAKRLSAADWILTTYETLRNFDVDFGAVRFAALLFDEAQKIKTPGIRLTDAAKAMNADFRIAMTGTPVENRLSDIWCIADTIHPALLGDLRFLEFRPENIHFGLHSFPQHEADGGRGGGRRDALWLRHSQSLASRRQRPSLLRMDARRSSAWAARRSPCGLTRPLDDLDVDARQNLVSSRASELPALIAAVGIEVDQNGKGAMEQCSPSAAPPPTPPDVGAVHDSVHQAQALHRRDVPLLALDLLACIETRAGRSQAPFSAAQRLAVDDRGGRVGLARGGLAALRIKHTWSASKAVPAPQIEIIVESSAAAGLMIAPPPTAGAQDIHQAVDNLAYDDMTPVAAALGQAFE